MFPHSRNLCPTLVVGPTSQLVFCIMNFVSLIVYHNCRGYCSVLHTCAPGGTTVPQCCATWPLGGTHVRAPVVTWYVDYSATWVLYKDPSHLNKVHYVSSLIPEGTCLSFSVISTCYHGTQQIGDEDGIALISCFNSFFSCEYAHLHPNPDESRKLKKSCSWM